LYAVAITYAPIKKKMSCKPAPPPEAAEAFNHELPS
jgi:hypothetical protein